MNSAPPSSLRQALRNRGLVELAGSYLLIRLANSITGVGLPLLLLGRFGFSPELGFTLAAQLAPSVLFGSVIGDLVDRWKPARVAVLSALGSAVVAFAFPLAVSLGAMQALAAALGLTYAFAFPARMALRSAVTPAGGELAVNSLMVSANRIPALVGPLLAAGLVGLGMRWVFWVSALIALTAAIILIRVLGRGSGLPGVDATAGEGNRRRHSSSPGIMATARRVLRRILVGNIASLAELMRFDRLVLGLTLHALCWMTAIGLTRLYVPTFAISVMPGLPGAYGYLVAAAALGGLAGAVLAGSTIRRRGGGFYLMLALAEAALWAGLALTGGPVLPFMLLFGASVCESVTTVIFYAEIQRRIGADLTGRYFATLMPLSDLFLLAGTLASGLVLAAGLRTAGIIVGLAFFLPLLALTPLLLPWRNWTESPSAPS